VMQGAGYSRIEKLAQDLAANPIENSSQCGVGLSCSP